MKTLLILSEMRSGSTWAGSLTNSTGQLGHVSEWLHAKEHDTYDPNSKYSHFEHVIGKSSTSNGVFAVKIFPFHLYDVRKRYGYDFVEECAARHDAFIVLLERLDRLGAAISATRAFQTGQWAISPGKDIGKSNLETDRYDREAILRHMAYIGESLAFWKNYLAVRGLSYMPAVYEEVLRDPRAYVGKVAAGLGVEVDLGRVSLDQFKVQRDKVSADWRRKFLEESQGPGSKPMHEYGPIYPRTLKNLMHFLTKRSLRRSGKAEEFGIWS